MKVTHTDRGFAVDDDRRYMVSVNAPFDVYWLSGMRLGDERVLGRRGSGNIEAACESFDSHPCIWITGDEVRFSIVVRAR